MKKIETQRATTSLISPYSIRPNIEKFEFVIIRPYILMTDNHNIRPKYPSGRISVRRHRQARIIIMRRFILCATWFITYIYAHISCYIYIRPCYILYHDIFKRSGFLVHTSSTCSVKDYLMPFIYVITKNT